MVGTTALRLGLLASLLLLRDGRAFVPSRTSLRRLPLRGARATTLARPAVAGAELFGLLPPDVASASAAAAATAAVGLTTSAVDASATTAAAAAAAAASSGEASALAALGRDIFTFLAASVAVVPVSRVLKITCALSPPLRRISVIYM